jgi:DNA-binding NtrC family response regulator
VSGAGGYLGIHSVEGHGATFTIYLPMPAAEMTPAFTTTPDTAARRRPAPTRASVLVVDSDHLQRDLTIQTLTGQGIRCLAASSFVEAMSLLRQQVGFIDLIVIDLSAAARDTSGETIGGIVQEIRSINPLTRVLGRMSQGNTPLPDFLAHDPFFRTLKSPALSRDLLQAVREILNLSNQAPPPTLA